MKPSNLDNCPSKASKIGNILKVMKKKSYLITFGETLILPPTKTIKPKIKLKSAMLLPNKVPIPIRASPFKAEAMPTKVSGKEETMPKITKEIRNSLM